MMKQANRWKWCHIEQPNDSGWYLTYNDNSKMDVLYYIPSYKMWALSKDADAVTNVMAWMELPKAPCTFEETEECKEVYYPLVNAYKVQESINTFGEDAQHTVAMEECAELIKEISKFIRGCGDREAIKEEMADVMIMLSNLQQIHHIPDWQLKDKIYAKQERLHKRMKRNKRSF